jgi:hypothetical protein
MSMKKFSLVIVLFLLGLTMSRVVDVWAEEPTIAAQNSTTATSKKF